MTHRRLAVATIVISTALVSCTGSPAPSPPPGVGSVEVALPSSPEALPTTDLAGYRQMIAGLHGTPVVVNVWASWCEPCKSEAPLLRQAAEDNPHVQFLGVDIQDSKEGALGFIDRYAIPYPSVFNPSADIRDGLALPGQPDTLFYDAKGILRATEVGQLSRTSLEQSLAKIGA